MTLYFRNTLVIQFLIIHASVPGIHVIGLSCVYFTPRKLLRGIPQTFFQPNDVAENNWTR